MNWRMGRSDDTALNDGTGSSDQLLLRHIVQYHMKKRSYKT